MKFWSEIYTHALACPLPPKQANNLRKNNWGLPKRAHGIRTIIALAEVPNKTEFPATM